MESDILYGWVRNMGSQNGSPLLDFVEGLGPFIEVTHEIRTRNLLK